MNNILDVNICYACGGCKNSCPFNALYFAKDEKGISNPFVDMSKCKECKKCVSRCIEDLGFYLPLSCYLLEDRSEEKLLNSSSGGAFYQLVNAYYEAKNTIVYGAAYDEKFMVTHQSAKDLDSVKKFRKSKYIQSDAGICYQKIKEQLESRKRILFSGTPCQVYGLRKYLQHDYENLFTIDLICTGVMSPVIFQKYLYEYDGKKISGFDWRYKHSEDGKAWNIMDSSIMIDGRIAQDELSILIKRLYGRKIGYKEACYSCKFACTQRYSDITLGDYWGAKSYFGDYPNKGTSAILINTPKGLEILQRINKESVNIDKICLNEIEKQNPSLSSSAIRPKENNAFWKDFKSMTIKALLKKYTRNSLKSAIKMRIASILPQKVVDTIVERK